MPSLHSADVTGPRPGSIHSAPSGSVPDPSPVDESRFSWRRFRSASWQPPCWFRSGPREHPAATSSAQMTLSPARKRASDRSGQTAVLPSFPAILTLRHFGSILRSVRCAVRECSAEPFVPLRFAPAGLSGWKAGCWPARLRHEHRPDPACAVRPEPGQSASVRFLGPWGGPSGSEARQIRE